MKQIIRDLKIHIILLIIALFVIVKFSGAPLIFEFWGWVFLRPKDNTLQYEILRVFENLSLAYMASLIFYIVVNYIPEFKSYKKTIKIVTPYLQSLYMYTNKINAYFKYSFCLTTVENLSKEKIKEIDDFAFPQNAELLMVSSLRNGIKDGSHVEVFNAKNEIIHCGKMISEAFENFDAVFVGNKAPESLITLINEMRSSGFVEKLLKVIPSSCKITFDGIENAEVRECYLDFYKDWVEFVRLEEKLKNYNFLKLGVQFRKATQEEVSRFTSKQLEIRKNIQI